MSRNRFIGILCAFLFLTILLVWQSLADVTPTLAATFTSLTFAVIGDYGTDSTPELNVASMVKGWNPDLIISTGDNYYNSAGGSAAKKYDESTGAYYCQYLAMISTNGTRCPAGQSSLNRFFPSLGNHDYSDAGTVNNLPTTYTNYFALPGTGYTSTSNNERYYDFLAGPVHFFVVNSNNANTSEEPDGTRSDSVQAQWLQAQLAASTSTWNIVYFHHPPYSSSSVRNSNSWMQWPFAQWGADAVLSGHAHGYERIQRDGIVYMVNGAGGASLYGFGTPIPGSIFRYSANYGAQKVIASETSITFEFYSIDNGGTLQDTYTIEAPTLTITSANGTVSRNPDQAAYHEGDVVQLTAAPDAGWTFTNWTGSLTSTTNPDSVTIHGNTSVTANYTQNEYTLTVTSANGTIARNPNQATYHEGDVVQLTAAPNAGWIFANWTGGLTSTANPGSITIHGNTSVTANYNQNKYTLTIISANGTVSKNPKKTAYSEGDAVQLTATPNNGWKFTGWAGGATGTANPGSVIIHGNTSVVANYIQNRYILTITSANGTVTKNPNKAAYHEGDVVQLTAAPNNGWVFTNWAGGLTGRVNPDSVIIHGNIWITANYKQITTLTLNSIASSDGWILEKGENLNTGGSLNSTSTTLRLGDNHLKKQYRSILSFKTEGLPDDAIITSVTLNLKQQSITGKATFKMFEGLLVDVRRGTFGTSALQAADFQALASKAGVEPFTAFAVRWYTFNLNSAAFASINKLETNYGLTQFRLRFKLDDNNNAAANYINFYSGDSAVNKPVLAIQYYVP